MLTANEIRNIRFTKSMGGYKTTEVDDFIEDCAGTVASLAASKAELEKKLEVLADKLVEYRNDEDNIRTALLSAQRLGDTVVREAKHKAGLILDDARIKAEKMQELAQRNIKDEELELERIRREITNFKARMLSIYREHLALIDILPEVREEKEQPAEQTETPPPDAAAEVETPVAESALVLESAEQSDGESAPLTSDVALDMLSPEEEAAADQTAEIIRMRGEAPVSRFGELKFGDDYDIAKDGGNEENAGFFRRRK